MKKTWKEWLHDVNCSRFVVRHIPTLPLGLALLSIVCFFVCAILFDGMLFSTIFYYMFYLLPLIGIALDFLFSTVRSYNKETFCCNKIRNFLLANESFVCYVLGWTLIIVLILVANIIFDVDSYGFRVTACVGTFFAVGLSCVINKPISKHFKKKTIHIENENTNVKCN